MNREHDDFMIVQKFENMMPLSVTRLRSRYEHESVFSKFNGIRGPDYVISDNTDSLTWGNDCSMILGKRHRAI